MCELCSVDYYVQYIPHYSTYCFSVSFGKTQSKFIEGNSVTESCVTAEVQDSLLTPTDQSTQSIKRQKEEL